MGKKKKAKLKKGIRRVGYALLDISEDGVIQIGNPVYFPTLKSGGRNYSADPRGDSQKIYADSTAVYGDTVNDGYDIKLTLLAVTDDVSEAWLNEQKDDNGIAEFADGEELPYFALIISEDTTDGAGQTTIYYYCQCSGRPSENGKTSEGGTFDFEFPEYPIVASPRPEDNLVRYRIPGTDELSTVPVPKKKATAESVSEE